MYTQIFEEDMRKKQSKKILNCIFTIGIILISIFIIRIFMIHDDKNYMYSSVIFVKQVNGLIAMISIISCLVLYQKTKDSIVFTLL